MKKLITIFTTCLAFKAMALPLGNPADPALYCKGVFLDENCDCLPFECLSLRFGYYGDFVFNRHLERTDVEPLGALEDSRFTTNAGLLTLNLFDRVDIFTTLGTSHAVVKTRSNFVGLGRVEAEWRTNFAWSVGGRAVLWQYGCTFLGLEGQYARAHLPLERFTADDSLSVYPDEDAIFSEWQIGLGLAHQINIFVPYIGIKWARQFTDERRIVVLGNEFPNFKNNKHIGYAVGLTITDCALASVTAEVRFGDEKALHLNGQIRF